MGSHTVAAIAAGLIGCCGLAPSVAHARAHAGADIKPGQPASSYFRYYHKQRLALPLDATRIAVHASDKAALGLALQGSGLDPAKAESSPLTGWWLVPVPQPATAAQVEKLVSLIASRPGAGRVSPIFVDDFGGPAWVFGDLLIGFPAGATPADRDALVAAAAAGKLLTRDYTLGVDRITPASNNGFEVLAKANELAQRADVLFAEADFAFTGKSHIIPNDTLFGNLWGIHNTGQAGGTADMDMDGPEAWDITTGSSAIIVTIIDVGVDLTHPDLNLAPGVDTTGSPALVGAPGNACDLHGTAVAGCVSARFNNGLGVVGIAPSCRSSSARTFVSINPACNGNWNSAATFTVDSLNFALAQGHRVTNNSNGYGFTSATIDTAYLNTYNAGIVHYASNGNSGAGSIGYPASVANVNGVCALQRNGNRASFSQFGPGTDISAPGQAIDSTDRQGAAGYTSGDYNTVDGTSFASPYSAGVAALVISRNPALTSPQVEAIIRNTAVDRGAAGFDNEYGAGFINAFAAVSAAIPAPANNACASAADVSAGGTFNGTLVGATNDGTATCGSSATNPDVWYTFTTACPGRLTVSTCGTNDAGGIDSQTDTVLSLRTTCTGTELACNDDAAGACGAADAGSLIRDSYLTSVLNAGQTVLIRVSKFSTFAVSPFVLNVAFAPVNDLCTAASNIAASSATPFCTTGAATDGPVEAACLAFGNNAIDKDIWFRYTPLGKGRFRAQTCGSAFDTKLAIYPNTCPGATGTALACNDDACTGTASITTLVGVAGTPYLIRLGGYNGASGSGTLIIYCAADVNLSGGVSVQDIFDFLAFYFASDLTADINGSNTITVQDIFDFLESYFSGC